MNYTVVNFLHNVWIDILLCEDNCEKLNIYSVNLELLLVCLNNSVEIPTRISKTLKLILKETRKGEQQKRKKENECQQADNVL